MNLPRSGWPTKSTPSAHRRLIEDVIKISRATFKELQASLASVKVSVQDEGRYKKDTIQCKRFVKFVYSYILYKNIAAFSK